MKKIFSIFVLFFLASMTPNFVLSIDTGASHGVSVEAEDFAPLIWMDSNARVVLEDNIETGRVSGPGRQLVERVNNYAFEGEQISYDVLVLDKNGIEKIEDVYMTIGSEQGEGNDIEANCDLNPRFIDYYEAVFTAADRLVQLQADITEDNAGNGDPDIDPDDGGWDWSISSSATEHSGVTPSWGNLYGVTALGIIGAYRLTSDATYFTSLEDVYTEQLQEYNLNPADPRIRTGFDVVELYTMYQITGDTKYLTLANDIYLAITTVKYPSAQNLAETIRDVRHGSGWDGLIPWDISHWVEAAVLLGYDADATAMNDVIYNDIHGSPGYYDLTDPSLNAYTLGLAGVIKSFTLTDTYYTDREDALTRLLGMQNPDGGFQFNSVWSTPSDLQSTAYAAIELFRVGQRQAAFDALDYIVSRQLPNGGFEDESFPGQEWPEVDAESLTAAWGQVVNALVSTLLIADIDDFGDVFDPDIMAFYTCTLTVETPDSMYGEYWVTAEVTDLDGLSGTVDENEYWFFNPVIAVTIEGDLDFGIVRPGTQSYSDTVLVGNDADMGSGVVLDMFITGTDFYDTSSSGAKCPTTNQLELTNFAYYATQGAYSTLSDGRNDIEGYVGINYGDHFDKSLYNIAEIIQGSMSGPYYRGNLLTPGAEIALTFRLALPEPCNGDFDSGSIFFWGEAI